MSAVTDTVATRRRRTRSASPSGTRWWSRSGISSV
ncbi:hypothetical protein E4K10_26345 [Streptomyces sp. T1317-0309]|nr:hypothetical protein E4K10_26345 [Streptomyces sp. T1317-0309]